MATAEPANLIITSPSFQNKGDIPSKYTCDGEGINPPLNIEGIPDGTQALAIITEDPDTTKGTFDHWVVWNIPVTHIIEENKIPGITGKNGTGKTGYHGPCPPSGSHRYFFYVFALDKNLDIDAGSDKEALKSAMEPHIVAKGTLMGHYQKEGQS